MHPLPAWFRSMPRHAALLACLLALSVEAAALFLGADASWDTRNYHLYDPFALLHKPFGVDIAPAHHQSFFSPTMDMPFYLLTRHVPWTPVLNALLAIPHAVAVVLTFVLTCRLMQARRPIELWIAALAVAFSAAGAASAPTLATAMDEMLPSCLFLAALLTLLPADAARWPTARRIFVAGLLAGAACGLKLTFSYAALALGLVVLLVPLPRDWRSLLARPVLLGAGGFIGAVLLTGYWWVLNWQHYGNPLFPMMNNIFRSPWTDPVSWVDPTYLPRSFGEAIGAPWAWALHLWLRGGESRLRDPRFALAVIAALLCLAQRLTGRRLAAGNGWPVTFVAAVVPGRVRAVALPVLDLPLSQPAGVVHRADDRAGGDAGGPPARRAEAGAGRDGGAAGGGEPDHRLSDGRSAPRSAPARCRSPCRRSRREMSCCC